MANSPLSVRATYATTTTANDGDNDNDDDDDDSNGDLASYYLAIALLATNINSSTMFASLATLPTLRHLETRVTQEALSLHKIDNREAILAQAFNNIVPFVYNLCIKYKPLERLHSR